MAPQADGSGDYRRRVTGLLRQGRALGIVDERGDVVFKADIGAVSERTCQVQGVWVRPDRRGRGWARPRCRPCCATRSPSRPP